MDDTRAYQEIGQVARKAKPDVLAGIVRQAMADGSQLLHTASSASLSALALDLSDEALGRLALQYSSLQDLISGETTVKRRWSAAAAPSTRVSSAAFDKLMLDYLRAHPNMSFSAPEIARDVHNAPPEDTNNTGSVTQRVRRHLKSLAAAGDCAVSRGRYSAARRK